MSTTTPLTGQQIAAITLLAQGADRAHTARALGMAVPTLDDHLASARHRLGARSAAHLVALAINAGIVPTDVAEGSAR